jgi:patatin-related protein
MPDERTWEPVREVRFAVVMYGGVSLAIYINGVAQELERLVRATAPDSEREALHVPDGQLASTDRVYREVARKLGGEDAASWQAERGADGDPVLTRFVVDILSGTSAGGINAIYLAKAMANGQTIEALRDLWINEADIDLLLNESRAYENLAEGVSYSDPPTSLLASQRLYVRALEALVAMGDERPHDAPHYADQVDLAVTTTDLQGLTTPVQLADMSIEEPRHRTLLRFGYVARSADEDDEDAVKDERNDFEHRDELLAFAARATSSFPFAFEPAVLRDAEKAMSRPLSAFKKQADDLFPDYARANADYPGFAFADGGYLDNKPFTGATETLRRRSADRPVDRRLLYVEPDPADPAKDDDPRVAKPAPDAIRNVGDALVGLPRFEPIREDIGAITDRNAAVQRVRDVTRDIELTAIDPNQKVGAPPVLKLAYLRLRRMQVVADLTDLVARTSETPPTPEQVAAIHDQLEASARGRDDGQVKSGDEHAQAIEELEAFLDDFDLRYRLRRIALLQDRINDLIAGGDAAEKLLQAARVDTDASAADLAQRGGDWLLGRKQELSRIAADIRREGRKVRTRTRPGKVGSEKIVAAATNLAGSQASAQAEALGAALNEHFDEPLKQADAAVVAALTQPEPSHPAELERVLTLYEDCIEVIDMAVFPLTYPDLGEVNPIDVYRISPEDAPKLVAQTKERPKLAGIAVGHFGGFLDQSCPWRQSATRSASRPTPRSSARRCRAPSSPACSSRVAAMRCSQWPATTESS